MDLEYSRSQFRDIFYNLSGLKMCDLFLTFIFQAVVLIVKKESLTVTDHQVLKWISKLVHVFCTETTDSLTLESVKKRV